VGHGRGAAVGSALANLMKAAGYDVTREYYINDAGNQMMNLAASVNARYLELFGIDSVFPENGYHGEDIVDTAKRIKAKYGDAFIKVPEAERLEKFKVIAKEEKLAALKEDLKAFNCEFDVWFSEQTLHDANKIKEACDELLANGTMFERDGALWLRSTAYGDDKDRVVIRDNGVPTYFAADIAYHKNKFARGFDRVINLWGADHHGYIPRMKAAVQAMGYKPEQLEILILQMVSLYRNGELVKMSKRTGKSVTLNELIEEVGTDAARFFFIMRSIDSQLDFDLTLATQHSNDNPVYYVQYAHARICSIMNQMAQEGVKLNPHCRLDVLTEPIEQDLIKKLGEYEELVATAARERAPHHIAHYVYELAGLFHSFYNQCRVLGVEQDKQEARLVLINTVGHTLRHALGILGVSAPEHM
jgi:arginyl-tRNA synthetase